MPVFLPCSTNTVLSTFYLYVPHTGSFIHSTFVEPIQQYIKNTFRMGPFSSFLNLITFTVGTTLLLILFFPFPFPFYFLFLPH